MSDSVIHLSGFSLSSDPLGIYSYNVAHHFPRLQLWFGLIPTLGETFILYRSASIVSWHFVDVDLLSSGDICSSFGLPKHRVPTLGLLPVLQWPLWQLSSPCILAPGWIYDCLASILGWKCWNAITALCVKFRILCAVYAIWCKMETTLGFSPPIRSVQIKPQRRYQSDLSWLIVKETLNKWWS